MGAELCDLPSTKSHSELHRWRQMTPLPKRASSRAGQRKLKVMSPISVLLESASFDPRLKRSEWLNN